MGEQCRYKLIRGIDTIEDCGIGEGAIPQIILGDIYGGYWNNEMKTRNDSENEIKTLDEIPIKINVNLPNLRTMLKDIERQFNGRYTIGDYLEEHGYKVTKSGKYVWFIKRR